ncbi:MAG: zinc ribbon domain-containing protein [Candidatus Enteromonas sp.]|nr:zinc ribbon domain-containing protein [Candidatus Enteromonas sp.]
MSRENYFDVLKISSGAKDKDIAAAIDAYENGIKREQNHSNITVAQLEEAKKLVAEMRAWAGNKDAVKSERTAFIAKQSEAVRSYFRLLENHYEAYKGEINSWVKKFRLTLKEIEALMTEDPNHTIVKIEAKTLPPNFVIASFDSYLTTIAAINGSAVINRVYPWAKDVKNLYSFLGFVMGESESKVRSIDTPSLVKVIAANKDAMIGKVGGAAGNDSLPFRNVFSQLQTVFNPKKPEMREVYDRSLIYYSLSPVFESLKETTEEMLKDDKFVANILAKIKEKFDDDEIALAIYNKEAHLLNDPYEPPKVVVSMRCSNCGSISRFSNHDQARKGKCSVCGKPFYMPCPNCGKLIPSSSQSCPECGLNIAEIQKIPFYIDKASHAFSRGDLEEANAYLDQALSADPSGKAASKDPKFASLKSKIEAEYAKFKKYLGTLTSLMAQKNFVAAKAEADKVKLANPSIDLSSQIKAIQEALNKARALMPQPTDLSEAAVGKCYQVLEIVSDFLSASEHIKKVPVQSPGTLRASLSGGAKLAVCLSFAPSPSMRVTYYLTRNESHVPTSYGDGKLLLSGSDKLVFEDSTVFSGKKYYYAVFACREGVFSRPATAVISSYVEVEKLALTPQGKKCSISFSLPANAVGARILRKENAIPKFGDPGTLVLSADCRGAFDDAGVEFDRQYGYLVQAVYLENNQKVFTPGVGALARIERDPGDADSVTFSKSGGITKISFRRLDPAASNAVRLYSVVPGNVEKRLHSLLPAEEALNYLKGEKLLASGKLSDGVLSFSLPGNYSYDVVLVSMTENKARFLGIGKISSIELLEFDPAKSEIKEGQKAYLRLKSIPPMLFGIHYLIVEDNSSKNQITQEDISRGFSSFVSASDYKKEGLIPASSRIIASGRFRVLSLGEFSIGGKRVLGETSVCQITNEGPKEVRYSIEWKKKGLFKKTLLATLHLEGKEGIPPLVLMGKDVGVPVSATDIKATEILRFSESDCAKVSKGVYTLELPVSDLYPDMQLRLFPQEGRVKLVSGDYASLKVPK